MQSPTLKDVGAQLAQYLLAKRSSPEAPLPVPLPDVSSGAENMLSQILAILLQMLEQNRQENEVIKTAVLQSMAATNSLIHLLSSPKQIISDKEGNPIRVEVVR